jgi:hypothetical protein
LETTTTARDIFKVVSNFFEEQTVSSGKTYVQFVQMELLPCWVAGPDFKL